MDISPVLESTRRSLAEAADNKDKDSARMSPVSDDSSSSSCSGGSSSSTTLDPVQQGSILPWTMACVWPLMSALPLAMTVMTEQNPLHYSKLFASDWYSNDNHYDDTQGELVASWRKPLGLLLGILTVAIGHFFLLPFFYMYRNGNLGGLPLSV
eukprot:CAMPEP_0197830772 /NCGR_PEP_ID=MMETSP1437-20131217/7391_1 /TAXON_ID=49252 ORGANISM="Eucampia antarctica, Strain CCMP1452" /NCGR_SAMPLE_ID=MMETSP1437 /ASSEMBLY_ACC=CAM_ASM_001096 /LENGTH=153 /DNA_ID=CAMNT_0043433377 /DNA_START=45 /DNA_END=503 /DNA_ORIENTATION=-